MSRREAARIFGINRRTVEKMLRFSIPPGYRRDKVLRRPKLDAYTGIMDQILGADRLVPKKQRHTSKRIFERQRDEHGFEGSITIVKNYIYVAKQHQREMFVPLTHPPGHAQADCDDALAIIGGIERKTHFFGMDLPHSDACFVKAYLADTTETFCDAHVAAFAFSGDVPKSILYDNTRIAVARGRATASANVPACSHGWYPVICLGSGNDKGKVEGMVIYTRRNFMVPKPKLASFDDLNAYLAEHRCKRMNDKLRGHKDTIGKQFDVDVNRLQHLPVVPYDACGKQSVRAISLSLMRYRGNNYSVSTTYGHQEVLVCGYICELVT